MALFSNDFWLSCFHHITLDKRSSQNSLHIRKDPSDIVTCWKGNNLTFFIAILPLTTNNLTNDRVDLSFRTNTHSWTLSCQGGLEQPKQCQIWSQICKTLLTGMKTRQGQRTPLRNPWTPARAAMLLASFQTWWCGPSSWSIPSGFEPHPWCSKGHLLLLCKCWSPRIDTSVVVVVVVVGNRIVCQDEWQDQQSAHNNHCVHGMRSQFNVKAIYIISIFCSVWTNKSMFRVSDSNFLIVVNAIQVLQGQGS